METNQLYILAYTTLRTDPSWYIHECYIFYVIFYPFIYFLTTKLRVC